MSTVTSRLNTRHKEHILRRQVNSLTLLLSLHLNFVFNSSKVDIHILVVFTNTSVRTGISILLKVVRSFIRVTATEESFTFESEDLLDEEFDLLYSNFTLRVVDTNLCPSNLVGAEDVLFELASQL